jgi:phosphatidylglycerol lysyltransferase
MVGQPLAAVQLPPRTLVLGGFSAFAIGNAIGLSMLSGGSVRYRLYARQGLSAAEVARMTVFASLSLGCALPPLAALATLSNLPAAATALRLPARCWVGLPWQCWPDRCLVPACTVAAWQSNRTRTTCWFSSAAAPCACQAPRLAALQLLITALDVAAAATVLYLLLPEAPPFGAFVLVYLLALAAGVLSHVPGGVGVFEAILLAAFANQLGAAPLAAALLLYRLIYAVLPLLVACCCWPTKARLLFAQQAIRAASGLAAPVLAILVFLSGVVLLFSGATPEIDSRLEHMGFLIPHRLIDASHFGASLIGVLCLLLAQAAPPSVSRVAATTVLLVGAVLSLLKGFDWEEATLMCLTAALLALFRRSFYRPSRLLELPFSPVPGGQRLRGRRVDLAAAVRLSGRTLHPQAVVAVHPRCRRPTRPARPWAAPYCW